MDHLEQVRAALARFRNRGATAKQVRDFVAYSVPGSDAALDQAVLATLIASGEVLALGEHYYLSSAAYRSARGSALPAEWEHSDAWILLAILMSRNDTSVADVLSVADYINHAVPTEEELHRTLNRLVATKLIRIRKSGISATDAARELETKAKASAGRVVLGQCAALRHLLACPHCGPTLDKVRWKRYTQPADWDRYTGGAVAAT